MGTRITFEADNFNPEKVRGYTYQAPIMPELPKTPIEFISGSGMCLDEIRERFGDKMAQLVYTYATQGVDITRPSRSTLKSREFIDIEIEYDDRTIKIFLKSSAKTVANEDILIGSAIHKYPMSKGLVRKIASELIHRIQ